MCDAPTLNALVEDGGHVRGRCGNAVVALDAVEVGVCSSCVEMAREVACSGDCRLEAVDSLRGCVLGDTVYSILV